MYHLVYGWSGKALYIDIGREEYKKISLSSAVLRMFIGGRGLAAKLLWDLNPVGVEPLSPENHLILSTGPLTGYPIPSSGKLVIASKSPLTGGYGDGNVGTKAAVELRKSGVDAVIIKGAFQRPSLIRITCKGVEFLNGDEYWGLTAHETESKLRKEFGSKPAYLYIGPAGENLVKYATIISEYGRSGGRPGMGAVAGSKKLKAVIIEGCNLPEAADKDALLKAGAEAYIDLKKKPSYSFWVRQGTMSTIAWSQKNSALPTYNFREAVFDGYENITGDVMEKLRVRNEACPYCNMPCRNYIEYEVDGSKKIAEMDYEPTALFGSNLGISDMNAVAHLSDLADDMGLDAISTGNVLGFAIEASQHGLIEEKIEWGDYDRIKDLIIDIAHREGMGDDLANGVAWLSRKLGHGSERYAMHVKGLEISAYDCHAAPGMALAYGTSSIGAHHKDAWFISLEIQMGRDSYAPEKADKLVWMQNIRGGLFESFVTCRLPWVELGLDLDYYLRFLKAATGVSFTWDELHTIANRVYALIRSFWIREFRAKGIEWNRMFDYPPDRWFEEPLTQGPLAGSKLDRKGYDKLLSRYYEIRGWDQNGVPKKDTLESLGLPEVANLIHGSN